MTLEELSEALHLLMDSDLESPPVEAVAREVLAEARKQKLRFQDPDRDCEDCSACLFMSVSSAAEEAARKISLLH